MSPGRQGLSYDDARWWPTDDPPMMTWRRHQWVVTIKDIHSKSILNANLTKSRLSITYFEVAWWFWNFAQSTAVILRYSVQNFKTIFFFKTIFLKGVMGKRKFARFEFWDVIGGQGDALYRNSTQDWFWLHVPWTKTAPTLQTIKFENFWLNESVWFFMEFL